MGRIEKPVKVLRNTFRMVDQFGLNKLGKEEEDMRWRFEICVFMTNKEKICTLRMDTGI